MGGMATLFGGGQQASYTAPDPVQTEPLPTREEASEPVAKAVRDEERRRLRSRRAMNGTLLSSPLGTTGGSSGAASSLLGASLG